MTSAKRSSKSATASAWPTIATTGTPIAPAAPAHIVVIPRGEPPVSPAGLSEADSQWVGRMVVVATQVAAEQGLVAGGYRLVINSGANAGQSVEHLHLHILGGGPLGPIA